MDKEELIYTIKELEDKLSDPKALISNRDEEFANLAKSLMRNFQIKRGDKLYWMTDIEFYIYTDEHKDIITYPRNCPAGVWFFHPSGVDIAFRSEVPTKPHPKTGKQKPHLEEGAFFGGILLRRIKLDDESARVIDGPLNVCDELFDQFSAFKKPKDFPRIIKAKRNSLQSPDSCKREGLNPNPKEKVHSILTNNYIDSVHLEDELVEPYDSYRIAKYRFHIDS